MTEYSLKDFEPVICSVLEEGGTFPLYPKGTSMLPLIRQGRDAVVLASPPLHCKPYDIIFYKRTNGQYVLHRILKADETGYTLCGDNQLLLEPGIRDSQILAVVTQVIRKGRPISFTGPRYRLYLLIWCRSLTVRRILLRLRRIVRQLIPGSNPKQKNGTSS